MTPDVPSAATEPLATPAGECQRALVWLRQQGAERYNPVTFHYMEALARRMDGQAPAVRQLLEKKLQLALTDYQAAYQADPGKAQSMGAVGTQTATVAQPPAPSALGQLLTSMAHHSPALASSPWPIPSSTRPELKSVRNFRNTWSQLSAQKQVAQALGQAPKNAGPINSHMLVLRSLALMRDISPDYLNRFMSYADTLLCLEQPDHPTRATAANPLASAKPKARALQRK